MGLKFRDWLVGAVLFIGMAAFGLVCGAGMVLLGKGTL